VRIHLTLATLFLFAVWFAPAWAETQNPSQVVINEIMASNGETLADEDGDFEDWIELYNGGTEPVDLEGWHISDDDGNPTRWTFPSVTLAPASHLIVWASGKDRAEAGQELHTNFRISAAGEPILLALPDGETLADHVPATAIPRDISYGRITDGDESFVFFADPTPGTANGGESYTAIAESPTFSHTPGYYQSAVTLSIDHAPGTEVRYTLDGSPPKADSPLYTGPIVLEPYDSLAESTPLSSIRTAFLWEPPMSPVFKARVVRAATFGEGLKPSAPTTATYFIDPDIQDRYSLPIFSISFEPDDLFGYDEGIYVKGKLWDEAEGFTGNWWRRDGNYYLRGPESEREAHVEFFETGGQLAVAQDMGVRIHGATSRALHRKSIRLYARSSYGAEFFEYPLFADRPYTAFKRILLRNGGTDAWGPPRFLRGALIRDPIMAIALKEHTNLDTQAYRPALIFLNGEYWGMKNIRDRVDRFYLQSRHGVDPDNLDILERNSTVKEGDAVHFQAMRQYMSANDLADPAHYEHVQTMMDVENFIDFQIAHIYYRNSDWPANNIDFWRLRVPYDPDAPYGHDGRWRWIVFDLDFGLGLVGGANSHNYNMITRAAGTDGNVAAWATLIFRSLLDNADFRRDFVNRFADLMNTAFTTERLHAFLDAAQAEIAAEIPEHIARWGFPVSETAWNNDFDLMRSFTELRPAVQRNQIVDFFDLSGTAELTVNPPAEGQGHIRVNTVTVGKADLPWTGTYFQGVPVTIKAIPEDGYVFAGWDLQSGNDDTLVLDLSGDYTIQPRFEPAQVPVLLHYWDFNDEENLLAPTYTLGGAGLDVAPGQDTEIEAGTGQGFANENARLGSDTGSHLRVNDPQGAELLLTLPTTGYEDILFSYESRRSGQGATEQVLSYTLDGVNFAPIGTVTTENDPPEVYSFDFSSVTGASDNPDFAIGILFDGEGDTGNNRFDNIVLEGFPLPGTNVPPVVVAPIGFQRLVALGAAFTVDLDTVFDDGNGDALAYDVAIDKPFIAMPVVAGSQLTVSPLYQGDATIVVTADDGTHPPVSTTFSVLVYPEAHALAAAPKHFQEWSPSEPEHAFPENMLFLQTDLTDPGIDAALDFAYWIPEDEYHPDDLGTLGFPYNNTRRTRLTGRGPQGISFINTGRDRDLGGALLALDTRHLGNAELSWFAETILENERQYGLTLQYRIGHTGPFTTLTDPHGAPLQYLSQNDGDNAVFGPVPLPAALLGKPHVQLLWRYHHVAGEDGPRAELGLGGVFAQATITFEGEGEGALEGEGEGIVEGEGEGTVEGEGEGSVEGEGEGSFPIDDFHTADQDQDNVINLSELLRIIQFFNAGGLHCAVAPVTSEDGYLPGPDPDRQDCAAHDSDYNPQDWIIDLSELLRAIQFFNSGGYTRCPDAVTEDGFCPGPPDS